MEPKGYQQGAKSYQNGSKDIINSPKGDQHKLKNDVQKRSVPGHQTQFREISPDHRFTRFMLKKMTGFGIKIDAQTHQKSMPKHVLS